MAALPNHTLCIVGEGPDLERLKQTARKQGVLNRVQFRKTCRTKDEAYQLIKGAKVFIHPSTREGFGMVVLESIALNTPVVTTDHPENAARTIVTKRSGVLSQPSTKSFVKAVRKAEKLTKSAIAKDAKPYEWSTIVRRHEKIYAE